MINDMLTLQICRWSLAFIWIYQGLVPKWFGPHADELAMNMALGLDAHQAVLLAYTGGSLEVILGFALAIGFRKRWPYVVSATVIGLLTLFTVVVTPEYLGAAFNSVAVNLAIAALSAISLVQLAGPKREE